MQVIGALLVIWGIADFALSWNNVDLYYEIGINVPADIYPYTAWVAIFIGGLIYRMGSKKQFPLPIVVLRISIEGWHVSRY